MTDEEVEEQLRFTKSNYVRGERQWRPQIRVTHNKHSVDITINCSIVIQDFDKLTVRHYVDVPICILHSSRFNSLNYFDLFAVNQRQAMYGPSTKLRIRMATTI